MKKLTTVLLSLILVITCSVSLFTASSANQSAIDIQQEKLIAEKEAAFTDYVPEEIQVPEYFYITAEKLGVDIEGLTPTEIMMKVKEAEVQYAYNQPITPEQQLELDKLIAEKEAALANYVPEEIQVPEYFYITAEKLGVDIKGLTPTEIMMKVKEAEAQYVCNQPITPEQQLELDKLIAEKEAALADYVPEEIQVPEYFYITAEKLGVDIEGLTPTEIMVKVKEAEVQYAIENSK